MGGRNGGLRLNANSMALTVGEVVRATENDFELVDRFLSSGEENSHRHCVIKSQCRLKDVFTAARSAFFAELDRHTISQLAEPSAQLATLLGMIQIKVIPADAPIPASAAG